MWFISFLRELAGTSVWFCDICDALSDRHLVTSNSGPSPGEFIPQSLIAELLLPQKNPFINGELQQGLIPALHCKWLGVCVCVCLCVSLSLDCALRSSFCYQSNSSTIQERVRERTRHPRMLPDSGGHRKSYHKFSHCTA